MKKILFLLILVFSIVSIINHNNFSATSNVCISSQIAEPIFNVNFNDPVILDNSNSSVKYSFSINNFRDEIVSDIPFSYYFYIENLPADFSCQYFLDSNLIESNSTNSNSINNNSVAANLTDSTEVFLNDFKSESFSLSNSKKEEHIFTININYTGNFTSAIISDVKIKLFYSFLNNSNSISSDINSLGAMEYNFLNIHISENKIDTTTSTPGQSSSKKSLQNKNYANSNKSAPNINSDVFIDTNTNIQIQISK